ncbi:PAS domain S-box-containing protein/diguanylate cyclase (GGDEF) domain-containing protein [Rhizobium sp. NFR07]|uniref:bifunctional diguanylate cyclase/phosphodiesterase n=1 Tax=Rhizobium sp. NFR07 TaxID=1566262 RepID=UPI0008E2DE61|nr:EAL domain-containing protein [Rhizobium sp. NFR07]SFB45221.1 PAS domain S-box-containing protein/diguanylate cyclase (GGDEF) domain-containing protein [Rhizobium sp. NFR07]
MYGVFTCLAYEHDLALVVVAGILCFLANLATVAFIGRAKQARRGARLIWAAVAGGAGGFGIWSTHFVAMLAYDPGLSFRFNLTLTLASLALAFISTFVAAFLMVAAPTRPGAIAAGMVFGAGVSCMHFTGMSAIEFGGAIAWSRPLVIVAIAAAVIMAPAAFLIALGKGAKTVVQAAAALSLAIVGMHFIAMGAVELVPDLSETIEIGAISKPLMLSTIIVVSLSLLGSGAAAAIISSQAARSSRATERNFQLLVRGVTDYAIYMLDPNGIVTNWNAGAERAKGYTAKEIVGQNFARFYNAEDQAAGMPANALKTARETGRFDAEGKRYRKDGSWFWAHVVIQPVRDEEGILVGYAKITRDITRQKEDSDSIAAITQNLDLALENMSQGICLFDRDEKLILSNGRYRDMFSFPEGFVVPGRSYWDIVRKGFEMSYPDPKDAGVRARAHYERYMAAMKAGPQSLLHRTYGGHTIRTALNELPGGGWVATFEDITEQVRSEEQIAFMARHDSLTQLPNRAAFMSYLEGEVLHAGHSGDQLAVVGIDLNKFKQINDQLGHAVGDEVLKEMARRMLLLMGPNDMFARFGGDEFVAAMRYSDIADVQAFLERMAAEFNRPMDVEGHRLVPGASMGVALYPNDGNSPEALIANADLAMYRAKGSLSREVCFYDVEMDEAARDRTKMAKDLWAAAEAKQFHLHYQVQKSISTGEITGYEVLLRWRHPERGQVSPVDFIGVAEECGAILPIGEWVLREACREAATWPVGHKVAVNLSPVQIAHADMPSIVHSVLLETGLKPSRLELEITESSIFADKQRALHALRAIKALGVSIAIDDFGTGYSSLETLQSFPFDKIKLDRSFLADVERSEEAKAMVRAILALGQGLRIPVLAEGVETRDQLTILRDEGCHEAQGYLLGRPMPIGDQLVIAAA